MGQFIKMTSIDFFYKIKPLIPRRLQIALRRMSASYTRRRTGHIWPISPEAAGAPEGWPQWPDNKKFALILIHDVDTVLGLENCLKLMNLEKRLGFRSSFNFVPEGYLTPEPVRQSLMDSGFEVGVHGLKHDGKLFVNRRKWETKARRINEYLREWDAVGFTSPSMLRNLDWTSELNIEYGCSTFDTDPFEPQPDGFHTIFPFWARNNANTKKYVELPHTLPQDYILFVILREQDNRIWKNKLDWVAANGGMALLNVHPDYINFEETSCSREQYPIGHYTDLLEYVDAKYAGQYWHVLPRELAQYWRSLMLENSRAARAANRGVKAP